MRKGDIIYLEPFERYGVVLDVGRIKLRGRRLHIVRVAVSEKDMIIHPLVETLDVCNNVSDIPLHIIKLGEMVTTDIFNADSFKYVLNFYTRNVLEREKKITWVT